MKLLLSIGVDFFAMLLLRLKLFLAVFNSTTWMPTCFNWLNMIYHLLECKAVVMQCNERRPSDWHLHSESEWVFCSVIIHHMYSVRDALWTITFLELATFGINLKASTCLATPQFSVFNALLAMPYCTLSSIAPSRSSSRVFLEKLQNNNFYSIYLTSKSNERTNERTIQSFSDVLSWLNRKHYCGKQKLTITSERLFVG